MTRAYLGLGANLGDPVQQIIDARNRLTAINGINELRSSSLYLTTPVGATPVGAAPAGDGAQRDFINCVFELHLQLGVEALFRQTQAIELELGRVRDSDNQNAARLIDIDLLLFDELTLNSDSLTLPHPRMHQRLFVLQPLAELDSQLNIGALGPVAELLAQGEANGTFEGQQIYKLGGEH